MYEQIYLHGNSTHITKKKTTKADNGNKIKKRLQLSKSNKKSNKYICVDYCFV